MQPSFPRRAGGYSSLRNDPALEQYSALNKNRWRYFRWTPRTAYLSLMYAVVVPGIGGYIFYATDGKWDMRAKLKGDTIAEW